MFGHKRDRITDPQTRRRRHRPHSRLMVIENAAAGTLELGFIARPARVLRRGGRFEIRRRPVLN
jgi:hypothetical protein